MNTCTVALSANAGVSITLGDLRIWVDALHRTHTDEYSSLTPALWAQMQQHPAFAAPDYIIYTHCHPDHYSRTLTQEAKCLWPQAHVILPEAEFDDQLLLSGGSVRFEDRGIEFHFIRLPHQGEQYVNVPHYGVILSSGDFHVLLAGDCRVCSTELARRLESTQIRLAILDFPWLTTRGGRKFVEEHISPEHLFICHLPFAEDDRSGYRLAAEKSASLLPGVRDIRLLESPLQIEQLSF